MTAPTKSALLEQFEMGDFGDVEFVELALEAGISLEAIETALALHRYDLGLSEKETG